MLWGNDDRAAQAPFASEMELPRITLMRDGTLVAASATELDFYSTAEGRLRLRGRSQGVGTTRFDVVSTRHINRFAVLCSSGQLIVYDVST